MLLSIWILGWRFSLKTIIAIVMLFFTIPVGQALFTPMDGQGLEVYNNLPDYLTGLLPNFGPLLAPNEPFIALVVGAGLCGVGLGLVFSANGSTGGTDIVVAIINKYSTLSLGRAMILMDAVIVTSGALVSHFFGPQYSWGTALGKLAFSFIEITIVGQMLDYIMNANKQSVQCLIVSTKYDQLSEAITNRLGRGCTILHGEGGYSHQPMHVVLVTIRKNMRGALYQIIHSVDPDAFVSESSVHGVYGQGFDSLFQMTKGRKK
jgi:yitT family protein